MRHLMALLKPLLTEFGIHRTLESCAYLYCLPDAHSSALAHDITFKSGHLTQTFLVTFLHFKLLWGGLTVVLHFPPTPFIAFFGINKQKMQGNMVHSQSPKCQPAGIIF